VGKFLINFIMLAQVLRVDENIPFIKEMAWKFGKR
jgi:hypothetical protein